MGINMGSGFESPDLAGEVVDWEEYQRWCDTLEDGTEEENAEADYADLAAEAYGECYQAQFDYGDCY